jgi:methyl-accepting chemotaxis protein/methyl-accepting chemotaxis protein-1 (serine sensor receptor)
MAAAAGSLKSQANELVQTVAVFKVSSGNSIVKTTVRSSTPKSVPFKGDERRNLTASSAMPKTKPKAPAAKPAPRPEPLITAKAPATSDEEWETF